MEISTVSTSVSSDIDLTANSDPNRRTVQLYWTFAENPWGFWHYDSHETAVHHKVGDAWQYESLKHVDIARHGVVIGGTLNVQIRAAEISVATITAGIQLTFYSESSLVCNGVPVNNNSLDLTSHHEWSVNDVH